MPKAMPKTARRVRKTPINGSKGFSLHPFPNGAGPRQDAEETGMSEDTGKYECGSVCIP